MSSIFAAMSKETLVNVYNHRRKMGQCTYGKCMDKSPKDIDHDGLCEKHTEKIVNHKIFTLDNFEEYIDNHCPVLKHCCCDNEYDPIDWLEKILLYQGNDERLAVFYNCVENLEHLEVDCLCYEDGENAVFFDIPEDDPFDLFFDWLDRTYSRC